MNKFLALIVSGGRTGTTFLGNFLSYMIEDSFSVHEPDAYIGINKKSLERIKIFGIYHMIIGRLLKRTGIRNLSQRYQAGELSLKELYEAVKRHRLNYYKSMNSSFIIESYSQWYGILPVVPHIFKQYKILGVVRDPRDWVSSWLNYEAHFGKRDNVIRLGFRRLDPEMVGDDQYAYKWDKMSSFQKLCWTWTRVYGYILTFTREDPHSILVRYEDLFLSDERERYFKEVLDFLSDFGRKKFHYDFRPELLKQKINTSSRNIFSDWMDWDPEHARQLHEMCGSLMTRFSYGHEQEWLEKLES